VTARRDGQPFLEHHPLGTPGFRDSQSADEAPAMAEAVKAHATAGETFRSLIPNHVSPNGDGPSFRRPINGVCC
jgi:hypothetical protein